MEFVRRIVVAEALIALALSSGFPCHSQSAPAQPKAAQSRPLPAPEDRIDINQASVEQLLKLPGMTRTWAARIVRFRPYRGKNDLLDRGIVNAEVYGPIRDYIIAHRPAQ